ncbi:MAG: cysteine--tRNA ligase, partial [Fibrobacterales bacterium]|nr:cysteine--tRNA ligase [Fibrobacterales bacterium]
SKSTGEFLTVDSLVKRGFSPMDYRYFALGSHYRNYLSFSFESLESARKSRLALRKRTTPLVARALAADAKISSEAALKWKERFAQAVGDDLNIPAALGLLHSAVRDDAVSEEERGALVLDFDRVLGLKLDCEEEAAPAAAEDSEVAEIDALVAERAAAKKAKDFARADEIRNDLAKRGIELKDGPQGTTWERKR